MEGESIVVAAEEQSTVLSEGEVTNIVEGNEEVADTTLPSDKVDFEVPEKFKGKSVEDVIKSYQELEKLKDKGGDDSQEEKVGEPTEETSKEEGEYNKYVDSFNKNGELSEAEYAELEKAGHSKEAVDNEITRYKELQDFKEYKQEKQLNSILEPLGGGTEKFKEVAAWANENKSVEDVKAFNEALATANVVAQQAMLRGLYAEFSSDVSTTDTVLHSGGKQTQPSKGYKTQEEFFKDIGSVEYQNNTEYRAAVEKKMSLSSIF